MEQKPRNTKRAPSEKANVNGRCTCDVHGSWSWSHLPRGVSLLHHLRPGEVDEEQHSRLGAAVVHVSLSVR